VVGSGDGLDLTGGTIGEAAVPDPLPMGVVETAVVDGANSGLDGTALELELVVHGLLERLVSKAEVVGISHSH